MIDLTFLVLMIPVLAIVLIGLFPSKSYAAIRAVTWIAMTAELILSLLLVFLFDRSQKGFQFVTELTWTQKPNIALHLGVDGISLWFVLLTSIVGFAALFATGSIQERVKGFFLSYFALVIGALGTFMSLDLFFFFFFYEIEALVTYPLISIWGRGDRRYAAMQFTIFSVLGSAFVLIGILAIYFLTGKSTLDFPALLELFRTSPLTMNLQHGIFGVFLIGFGILAALWPFHAWGPIGYADAPPAASMMFAGVMKKLGAYGLIRLGFMLFPETAQIWSPLIAGLALMNLIYVGFVALAQKDLRYLIGYSSSSHMGFVLIGLACSSVLGLSGALLVMFAHGILVALFFLLLYVLEQNSVGTLFGDVGGLATKWPVTAACFSLAALAASGVPGFANFAGEIIVLFAVWDRYGWLTAGVLIAIVITALYMLRAIRNIFFGPEKVTRQIQDEPLANPFKKIAFVTLVGVLLFVGFFPNILLGYFGQSFLGIDQRQETRDQRLIEKAPAQSQVLGPKSRV